MGPVQTFAELRSLLGRRAPMILTISFVGIVATVLVALNSVPVYQAQARLSHHGAEIAEGVVRLPGGESAARRVQQIEQQLTARDYLLGLADRHDMFVGLPVQQRVEQMRGAITLISIARVEQGFNRDGSVASLMIHARADTGPKAAALANELAEAVVDISIADRAGRTRETLEFLRAEEARIEAELRATEAEARRFAAENYEAMPVNASARAAEAARLQENLLDIEREITGLEAELARLGGNLRATEQRRADTLREQLSVRTAEAEQVRARIDALEPLFRRFAEVAREVEAFERRETELRGQLRGITAQLGEAQVTARLEGERQVERFEILESALVPDYPISRSRKVMVAMGAVAATGLAFMLAWLLEFLRPVIRHAAHMERAFGVQPVLSIPHVPDVAEKRRVRLGWLGGSGLALLIVLALAIYMQQL